MYIKNNTTMKKFALLILGLLMIVSITSCGPKPLEGDPIIVKKEVSIVPGYCLYTYEGWGRREYFEDPCDKYNVGDKLTDTTTNE